jgi:hypothetical protein
VKWPQVLEDDESEAAPLGPVFERWMDEYGQCVQAEPLRPRAAGSSAVVDDVPGSVLLAAEEQDLLSGGGWDFFDLQDAYALQEMEEADRRRQESWRGAEGGFHE